MAGQTITVQMDPSDKAKLDKTFNGILDGLENMDPFWDAVEMHMIDSLTQNFEQEGRPIKWEPLAESTINGYYIMGPDGEMIQIREGRGEGAKILQDTGALKASINSSNTDRGQDSLMLWAGEKHGLFHQYVDLDPMSQFGMLNKNERAPMPMRPFILFQDEDIDTIENIAANYLQDISSK